MSSKKKIEVICPKCSEKQDVIIWVALNVTLNPEAKAELLKGIINRFECQNCGSELPVRIGLLYHDMEKEFCVQYVPFEMVVRENLTVRFNKYGNLSNGYSPEEERDEKSHYDYMRHIQIVLSMEELIRYVVFREKLFSEYQRIDTEKN